MKRTRSAYVYCVDEIKFSFQPLSIWQPCCRPQGGHRQPHGHPVRVVRPARGVLRQPRGDSGTDSICLKATRLKSPQDFFIDGSFCNPKKGNPFTKITVLLVWGTGGIHRTNGKPVSGETVSPVIHRFFTGYFTNFVSKFEKEFDW